MGERRRGRGGSVYHPAREVPMSLRALIRRPMPVTAPLVLNPLMARMAEAAGFLAGYLGGGATGYQKVALEANLNVTEMCLCGLEEGEIGRASCRERGWSELGA